MPVKKNDIIISFDSEIQRLKNELDKVEMALRSMDYKVTMALAKKNFLSNNEYKQKTLEYKAQQIRAQLSALESNSNIKSPIDGVVAENAFREGDFVDQQNNLFIRVIDPSLLRISLSLPSNIAEKLSVGKEIIAIRDQTKAKGIIRGIAPSVDPKTGTILIDIDITSNPKNWTVGLYAQVFITLEESLKTPALPAQSIVSENNKFYIYKIKEKETRGLASENEKSMGENNLDTVEKVEVQLGITESGITEIINGLAMDDSVVVQGLSFVSDGAKVEVRE
jgi:RND family efflux transporter MFP subunit